MKGSILLFYAKIFYSVMRKRIIFAAVYLVATWIGITLMSLLICLPVSNFWDLQIGMANNS
jgi:hypothetical protein